MIHEYERFLGALLTVLAACAPGSEEVARSTSAEAPEAESRPGVVDIPVGVRRNLGIRFAEVEVRHVERTLRVPGSFELQPLARHEYRLMLPGRVELLVDQYQHVEPGAPLFRYRSPAWPELLHEILVGEQAMQTSQAEVVVARAALAEARGKLELVRERVRALAGADFKRADLEFQAAELEAALPRLEAEVALTETGLANARRTRRHALHRAATAAGIPEEELEAELSSGHGADDRSPPYLAVDWIEVRALDRGVVEALSVTDGAFVEPPGLVLSTVDPERLRFRAPMLQSDLRRITGDDVARIVPAPSPGGPTLPSVPAELAVGLEADPEGRTIDLVATPRTSEAWGRPGVSAFLEIVVEGDAGPTLAIPTAAVVRDGLTHVFFRRDPTDPNAALRVEADLGASDGRWVVLKSGAMRGDEVVVEGAYELALASQQGGASRTGGHVHADGSVHEDH